MNTPGENEFGGYIDDFRTALRWRPILPMLEKLEQAQGTAAKARALRRVAEFVIVTGFKRDPYAIKSFVAFSEFVELLRTDDEWRRIDTNVWLCLGAAADGRTNTN